MTAPPPPAVDVPCQDTAQRIKAARPFTVLVVGNPNVGKTTLINALAGTNLKVGNWSGVTVEKREAHLTHAGQRVHLLDLPGAYSLSPHTPEEVITRTALLDEAPDLILNVLDAGNLERNLYLTLQLLEFEVPVVIALNLVDEAQAKGLKVEAATLERLLGVPVVPVVASQGKNVRAVLDAALRGGRTAGEQVKYPAEVRAAAEDLQAAMTPLRTLPTQARRYLALALLEGDPTLRSRLLATGHADLIARADAHAGELAGSDLDPLIEVAEARYARAHDLTALSVPSVTARRTLTDRLDSVALHPWLGIPVFLLMVLLVFRFTFQVAGPFVDLIGGPLQGTLAGWSVALLGSWAPGFVRELIVGAIIPGVGTVLSFLPTLLALYLAMSFLEDSGYMARAAFLADRLMRAVGLDGKAFIPLMLGFGCNVPAVYATRTLEKPRDRVIVSMVLPFMSCSARLPVYIIFAAALFPQAGTWVVWGLYILGLLVAAGFAWLLRRLSPGEDAGGVMLELPPYRLPTAAVLWKHAAGRTRSFVRRARTTVLTTVIVVWALLSIPAVEGGRFASVPPAQSLFGAVSRAVSPVFAPLGFGNWQATGALVPGFIAKEVVVGTLGQIYLGEQSAPPSALGVLAGAKEVAVGTWTAVTSSLAALPTVIALPQLGAGVTSTEQQSPLAGALARAFSPAAGLAYLVFVLLYTPCIATVGAIAAEHGRRVAWVTVAYQLACAWLLALITFQIARFFL